MTYLEPTCTLKVIYRNYSPKYDIKNRVRFKTRTLAQFLETNKSVGLEYLENNRLSGFPNTKDSHRILNR